MPDISVLYLIWILSPYIPNLFPFHELTLAHRQEYPRKIHWLEGKSSISSKICFDSVRSKAFDSSSLTLTTTDAACASRSCYMGLDSLQVIKHKG